MPEKDTEFTDSRQLLPLLADLLEGDSLELLRCPGLLPGGIIIPYMLNDAAEDLIWLTGCTVSGDISLPFDENTSAEAVDDPQGLILRRSDGTVVSLWYERAFRSRQLYDYGPIGHFWREGQPHWRRLVYMIGTIRDKFLYLGPESCSEEERQLGVLAGFAPFRFYSPIEEDLEFRYPNDPEGAALMQRLAREAGDSEMERAAKRYALLSRLPFMDQKALEKRYARLFDRPARKALYSLLLSRVLHCASVYPKRPYSPADLAAHEALRRQSADFLKGQGFAGTYPLFYRDGLQVYACEEHPFTSPELDYEDFSFRLQWLVSCGNTDDTPCGGFFTGCGTVCHDLPELKKWISGQKQT